MPNESVQAQVLLVLFALLFAPSLLPAQTQGDLNAAAGTELAKAEAELESVLREIHDLYADEPRFLEKLDAAQEAWATFRDAELEALFPPTEHGEARDAYGSVFPMCWATHEANLIRERSRHLRTWIEGIEEGDVCRGSVRMPHPEGLDRASTAGEGVSSAFR